MSERSTNVFQDPLVEAGLAGLGVLFAEARATPLDATRAYLARIERLNGSLNAFVHIDARGAIRAAEDSAARWAAGRPLSPLDGAPIAVKANIAVRGLPWHGGIGAYRHRIGEADAACVQVLRQAGLVMLGIVNMDEAALGAMNDNAVFGRCHNPYRQDATPGGSSGGSAAAVGAGLCAAALGTDTMGSVRIPAAYCGTFGHMPARGRVSAEGVMPLSWTLDRVGWLTRSAPDAAALLEVFDHSAGPPVAYQSPVAPRLGALDLSGEVSVTPDIAAAMGDAVKSAEALGWPVRRMALNGYQPRQIRRLCLFIAECEAKVEHQAALDADPAGFSAPLRGLLDWASQQSAPKLAAAYRRVRHAGEQIRADLAGFDAVIAPATATTAFDFADPVADGQADFTLPANVAGLAAAAFPVGMGSNGLPISLQVMARCDRVALAIAARFSRPTARPPGVLD